MFEEICFRSHPFIGPGLGQWVLLESVLECEAVIMVLDQKTSLHTAFLHCKVSIVEVMR